MVQKADPLAEFILSFEFLPRVCGGGKRRGFELLNVAQELQARASRAIRRFFPKRAKNAMRKRAKVDEVRDG
jgi:hypothetical protein